MLDREGYTHKFWFADVKLFMFTLPRATMVRFVGGLGDRSVVPGIGSSRPNADAKKMLQNLQPMSKKN